MGPHGSRGKQRELHRTEVSHSNPAFAKAFRPSNTLISGLSTHTYEGEKGKGLGGGGSPGELGEGPGVADLQRCWGCHEQSYQG